MDLGKIDIGRNCPEEINAVIEVSTYCAPAKYELEKDNGALKVGRFARILAVPIIRLTPLYQEVHDYTDIARSLHEEIARFFEQCKALEPGKWARVDHWSGIDEAKAELVACVERFNNQAA